MSTKIKLSDLDDDVLVSFEGADYIIPVGALKDEFAEFMLEGRHSDLEDEEWYTVRLETTVSGSNNNEFDEYWILEDKIEIDMSKLERFAKYDEVLEKMQKYEAALININEHMKKAFPLYYITDELLKVMPELAEIENKSNRFGSYGDFIKEVESMKNK